MNKKLILALVITHNRLKLLKRCLENIEKQSLKPDEILVIDNDSNDGTLEFLKNNYNFISQKNEGSASGWHSGISYALKNNYEFIWMMDDDGYPALNSLELLFSNLKNEFVSISSLVIDENDHQKLAIPLVKLDSNHNPILFKFDRKIRYVSDLLNYDYYNYAHFFNGTLVKVEAIKVIGNINKNFYLYGEEVDFFHRLRKLNKVVTYVGAKHYHPSINKEWTRIKSYYYLKNSIYLNFKYLPSPYLRSVLNVLALIYRVVKLNKSSSSMKIFDIKFFNLIILAFKRGMRSEIKIDYHD